MPGHWAKDCTEPPKMRPRVATDMEMMVDEVYWDNRTSGSTTPAWHGILDGGATTLMAGSETIKDYLAECHGKGYPIEELKFSRCRRPFRLGNGKIANAHWCGEIPASFKHKTGSFYIYLVPRRTPIL